MSDILVIQNDAIGSIGHFGTALAAEGARLTVMRADLGARLSLAEAAQYHGLVVLGGRASAFSDEDFPFLPHVIELITAFQAAQKPVFGICLGAQLLARANGGAFASNNGWEVGFVPIEPTAEAAADPVFGAMPKGAKFYELHEDQFRLPEGATLLMTGDRCTNQAFRAGAASYGIQFHPEITEEALCAMARDLEELTDETGQPMTVRMLDYAPEDFVRQEALCEGLAQRWFALVTARAVELTPA